MDIKRHWVSQLMQDHFGEKPVKDWGDDSGAVHNIEIRCDRENNNEENGCGWTGMTRTVTEYGATTWEVEECPRCDSPVVGFND